MLSASGQQILVREHTGAMLAFEFRSGSPPFDFELNEFNTERRI
jgi:hypothetical protein